MSEAGGINAETLQSILEAQRAMVSEIVRANQAQNIETVRTMMEEFKKPAPPSQREIDEIKQAQSHRAETAASKLEEEKNNRWVQIHGCNHEHATRAGGGTHAVFVRDNDVPQSPGYIICQKCIGRFRPVEPLMMGTPKEGEDRPVIEKGGYRNGLDPKAIFDTGIFNSLLQHCVTTGAEILG
jgi:hypothetical protein